MRIGPDVLSAMFKSFLKGVKGGKLGSYQDARSWIREQVPTETAADQVMDFIFAKLTKKAVHFEHPAKGKERCRECMHFYTRTETCSVVAGEIRPQDWCDHFERINKRGA